MLKKIAIRVLMGLMLAGSISRAADSGFFFHPGDTVVFLGDSITEQRLYTTYIEAYTLTRFPQQAFIFRNSGWNGDTSWLRMRAHPNEPALFAANDSNQQAMIESAVGAGLKRDILPIKPTAVTVDFGMNDHAYQAFRPDIFKAYTRSQAEIVKVLKQNGARVALLTPQPIEDRRADPDKDVRNQSLRQFSDGLKIVASNEGALFVDQFSPYLALMLSARATNLNATIGGGDAIHPGPAGHTLMAWAILKGLGAPAEVSSVEFDLTRPFWHRLVRAENCKVSKASYTDGTLSFLRSDVALPMPIDPRAMPALTKAPILDDLNRYELKVAGLKSDRYVVKIDGETVVTVGPADLAKGLNLAVTAGPISRQALEVLSLVVQKNNLYYERWRKCQLSNAAVDQARIPDLDHQIAALEKQIDATRQPKPHRFEVTPLAK